MNTPMWPRSSSICVLITVAIKAFVLRVSLIHCKEIQMKKKTAKNKLNLFTGNCTCDSGFGGSDCSFDVTSPPTITKLSGDGICDKSEDACEFITLYGHYFLENMGTTCYVTRKEVCWAFISNVFKMQLYTFIYIFTYNYFVSQQ